VAQENRKHFFDNFSEKRGFDALIPQHWYATPRNDIIATKVSLEKGESQIVLVGWFSVSREYDTGEVDEDEANAQ
jgi:type 1 glutamine amidotransferase